MFDTDAMRVMALAMDEARRLNHARLEPEHVLIAIVREGRSRASHALRSRGLDLATARERVARIHPVGEPTVIDDVDMSSDMKRLVERARSEAKRVGLDRVTPDHLLMAVVHEPANAAFVLGEFELVPTVVRNMLARTPGADPHPLGN